MRAVEDQDGRQLPAVVVGGVVRDTLTSTVDAKDVSQAPVNGLGQRVVSIYSPEALRYGTGANRPEAEAAVTADGSGDDPIKPAGKFLVALPAGHSWLALVPDSAASASVDTTIEWSA